MEQAQQELFATGEPQGERPPKVPIGPRVRVMLVRETGPLYTKPVTTFTDIWKLLRSEVERWDRERFLTVLLNGKHRIVGLDEVSVGSLTTSLVHPREVFKAVILANAVSFICVHNHPSGDPTPSAEDTTITKRLKDGADLVGIKLLDHIIFGHGSYHSMADAGTL